MKWMAVLALVFVAGCSASEESTTGKRVTLDVKIAATPASKGVFTTASGWTVKLDKALVATGALYFYDGEIILSHRTRTPRQKVGDFFVPPAYAHPGHYVPGNAKGEMLTPSSADLLAGDAVLGRGNGVSGFVRSATFSFSAPAQGPHAAALGANVAVVEGTATQGAETRVFRAEVAAAELLNTKNAPQVEGCPFAHVDVQGDGVVTITVDAKLWFDQVDFANEAKSADGKPVPLATDGVARNGLVRGMKAGLAYRFAFGTN